MQRSCSRRGQRSACACRQRRWGARLDRGCAEIGHRGRDAVPAPWREAASNLRARMCETTLSAHAKLRERMSRNAKNRRDLSAVRQRGAMAACGRRSGTRNLGLHRFERRKRQRESPFTTRSNSSGSRTPRLEKEGGSSTSRGSSSRPPRSGSPPKPFARRSGGAGRSCHPTTRRHVHRSPAEPARRVRQQDRAAARSSGGATSARRRADGVQQRLVASSPGHCAFACNGFDFSSAPGREGAVPPRFCWPRSGAQARRHPLSAGRLQRGAGGQARRSAREPPQAQLSRCG